MPCLSQGACRKSEWLGIISHMSLVSFFERWFAKKKSTTKQKEPSLLSQIGSSMELLLLKAGSLTGNAINEKNRIVALSETAAKLRPLEEIAAVKFEQDILGRITAVSSACDTVLAGKDTDDLNHAIDALAHIIGQRKNLESGTPKES